MSKEDWPDSTYAQIINERHSPPIGVIRSTCPTCGKVPYPHVDTSCRVCRKRGCTACHAKAFFHQNNPRYGWQYVCQEHVGVKLEDLEEKERCMRESETKKRRIEAQIDSGYYGSEKQLKWASDIKRRFHLIANSTGDKTIPDIPHAEFWINHRNETLDQLREAAKRKEP